MRTPEPYSRRRFLGLAGALWAVAGCGDGLDPVPLRDRRPASSRNPGPKEDSPNVPEALRGRGRRKSQVRYGGGGLP
jgi:hypothetical protein